MSKIFQVPKKKPVNCFVGYGRESGFKINRVWNALHPNAAICSILISQMDRGQGPPRNWSLTAAADRNWHSGERTPSGPGSPTQVDRTLRGLEGYRCLALFLAFALLSSVFSPPDISAIHMSLGSHRYSHFSESEDLPSANEAEPRLPQILSTINTELVPFVNIHISNRNLPAVVTKHHVLISISW